VRKLLLLVLVGCGGDLDQPWDLDHDRIVAIRAEPAGIVSGETSRLDGLLAGKGVATSEREPIQVIVTSPQSLAEALSMDADGYLVTAPDEARLDAARTELGLDAGAPVPLQLGVAFTPELVGIKTIRLGMTSLNPALGAMQIDGAEAPAPGTEIVIGIEVDVPVSIETLDTDEVNWLTSCGEMHDFDLPSGYIRVEDEVDTSFMGELAVVLRDDNGGVTWQVWPIRAE